MSHRGLVPIIAATTSVAMAAKRRRFVNRFDERQACSPESARTLVELELPESRLLSRLQKAGVVVPMAGGRYYLNRERLREYRAARRRRALTVLVLAAVAVVVYLLMSHRQ